MPTNRPHAWPLRTATPARCGSLVSPTAICATNSCRLATNTPSGPAVAGLSRGCWPMPSEAAAFHFRQRMAITVDPAGVPDRKVLPIAWPLLSRAVWPERVVIGP